MKLHCGDLYIITKYSMNVEGSAKLNVCLTKCRHVHIANIDFVCELFTRIFSWFNCLKMHRRRTHVCFLCHACRPVETPVK